MLERLSVEPRANSQCVGLARSRNSVTARLSLAVTARLSFAATARLSFAAAAVLVLLIRAYQWFLAPLFGACCRFEPSCSRYTIACIERGGPLRGLWWGLRRLSRCHPFCAGGHDPPPEFSA